MPATRKRAPSKKSLLTKERIFNAAEISFSKQGFEGASLRDIAKLADVPVGLVRHHGGSKEDLFTQTVKRRADQLATIRLRDLETLREQGSLTLSLILDCFFRAYVKLVSDEGESWFNYGRLVAHVSADPRWQQLAADCFDPTTHVFLEEILKLYPEAELHKAATGQVYSVAALLAFFNSTWRIESLGGQSSEASLDDLVKFCAAGMHALLSSNS
ncbi:TetR family transcriptional regulator [Sneathiella limimaris]|uniref:TetR family transcriptional regulator n=1 Tax=Sneathiella limimaris TaxID=1964213 RepID=UPI00146DD3EE